MSDPVATVKTWWRRVPPTWRSCVWSFVAGAVVALAVSAALLSRGLLEPEVHATEFQQQTREKKTATVAKRRTTETKSTATPMFLTDSSGRAHLAYRFDQSTREAESEDRRETSDTETMIKSSTSSTRLLSTWDAGLYGCARLRVGDTPRPCVAVTGGFRVPLDKLGVPPRYSLWLSGMAVIVPPTVTPTPQPLEAVLGLGARGEF